MTEEESKANENDSDDVALGKKLKLLRESRGYSIEDVAGQLCLYSSLVVALESGDYKNIPSKIYVKGYIRNFIKLFDAMSEFESFDLFEIESSPLDIIPSSLRHKKTRKFNNFKFNNLFYLVIMCAFLGGLYYLEIEYALVNKILQIVPSNNDVIEEKNTIISNSYEIIKPALIKSDSIKMQFSRDSWTQVKDATGNKLISRFV